MSIGHISESKVWISLEKVYRAGFWLGFGPTYNGTTAGMMAGLGGFVFIAHFRPAPHRL